MNSFWLLLNIKFNLILKSVRKFEHVARFTPILTTTETSNRRRYDEYLVYAALLCLLLLLWCESDEQVLFDGKANVFVLRRRNLLCFTRFHIATTLDAINNIELVEETSYMIGHTGR